MLLYLRLISYTAGTLLQLFWMVVILGYRRQRNFERVFFFFCLSLFLFYGGSLLALNAQIYYSEPPALLTAFAKIVLCAGLSFLPPLLIHLHCEYAETLGLFRNRTVKHVVLLAAYALVVYFALRAYPVLVTTPDFDFLIPGNALGQGYGIWLAASMLMGVAWEFRFLRIARDRPQRSFHGLLTIVLLAGAAIIIYLQVLAPALSPNLSAGLGLTLALLALLPSAVLIYLVQHFDFLQIGRQKNLLYAVSATFLALLYLALVRRVGVWLEPILPPEASAAILLFVLVVFIEPIQRILGRRLQETAQQEMDRVQRLTAEIQQEARQGNSEALVRFIEKRIREEFALEKVILGLVDPSKAELPLRTGSEVDAHQQNSPASIWKKDEIFVLRQQQQPVAVLKAEPHGASLSGEARAALEFLCEQLPGALDLCRLIEEKLRLERDLSERERLALVGQMAASISHNLKNPLGSIKTILQVQLESPEMPDSLRGETEMVLKEVGRLSTKLNQLLQFSRPAVRGGSVVTICDASAVLNEVAAVLRHEAERRNILLDLDLPAEKILVAASTEAVSDIASNLLINALEATRSGGHVRLSATTCHGACQFRVEDDGPGISPVIKEKILQPFFTTKSQGTGLGLAIVARRVAECGGQLEWDSPAKDGLGTCFRVTLPRAAA